MWMLYLTKHVLNLFPKNWKMFHTIPTLSGEAIRRINYIQNWTLIRHNFFNVEAGTEKLNISKLQNFRCSYTNQFHLDIGFSSS